MKQPGDDIALKLWHSLALRIAPYPRRHWAKAMLAELPYIPAHRRPAFLFGMLIFILKERIYAMPFKSEILRFSIMVGTAAIGLICFANVPSLYAKDTSLGIVLAVLGLLWSAATIAIIARQWRAAFNIALGGAALYLAIGLVTFLPAPELMINSTYLRLLALEGLALSALLGGAITILKRLILTEGPKENSQEGPRQDPKKGCT